MRLRILFSGTSVMNDDPFVPRGASPPLLPPPPPPPPPGPEPPPSTEPEDMDRRECDRRESSAGEEDRAWEAPLKLAADETLSALGWRAGEAWRWAGGERRLGEAARLAGPDAPGGLRSTLSDDVRAVVPPSLLPRTDPEDCDRHWVRVGVE